MLLLFMTGSDLSHNLTTEFGLKVEIISTFSKKSLCRYYVKIYVGITVYLIIRHWNILLIILMLWKCIKNMHFFSQNYYKINNVYKNAHTPFMQLCMNNIFETILKPLYYLPDNMFCRYYNTINYNFNISKRYFHLIIYYPIIKQLKIL